MSGSSTQRRTSGWIGFAALVAVAVYFFGGFAICAALLVVSFACVRAGMSVSGWRRFALISTGALLIFLPAFFVVDALAGTSVLTVR